MSQTEFFMMDQQTSRTNRGWVRVLWMGLLAFAVGLILLILTGNPILFPTVVLIGNFTIPIAYVAFFYERRYMSRLNMSTTSKSFLYGGVLGVFAAALLEPLFIGDLTFLSAFQVGLIEEFAKILCILVIARRLRHDLELDGLILGAAAGMGFAASESHGYSFVAFLGSSGNLSTAVAMTLFRGILSPIGHGTWTAILASVLFREADARRFRITLPVVGAYILVSVLHGLWDGLPLAIAAFLSGGYFIFLGQVFVGIVGFYILWRRWQEGKRTQIKKMAAPEAAMPEIKDA
jgi:protease PrsW